MRKLGGNQFLIKTIKTCLFHHSHIACTVLCPACLKVSKIVSTFKLCSVQKVLGIRDAEDCWLAGRQTRLLIYKVTTEIAYKLMQQYIVTRYAFIVRLMCVFSRVSTFVTNLVGSQHAQVDSNKSMKIGAMTTMAWKTIPQRSKITLVWNPTSSGP